MSGPIRTLSGMIDDVREQSVEIVGLTERMREASRALTGSTGQAPTPLSGAPGSAGEAKEPPTLIALTIAIANLNGVVNALRDEVNYYANLAGTRVPAEDTDKLTAAAELGKTWR